MSPGDRLKLTPRTASTAVTSQGFFSAEPLSSAHSLLGAITFSSVSVETEFCRDNIKGSKVRFEMYRVVSRSAVLKLFCVLALYSGIRFCVCLLGWNSTVQSGE